MIIQSLWIGQLSEIEKLSINSFLKNGYEFHLYVYDDIGDVPFSCKICDANEILSKSKVFLQNTKITENSYAAFSDLFRYKLLLDKGEVWCDLDVINLNKIPEDEYIFVSEHEHLNGNFIKVPKNSDIMKNLYEMSLEKLKDKIEFGEIGPFLLDEIVKKFDYMKYVLPYDAMNKIHCFDAQWFFIEEPEFIGKELYNKIKDSYCIHLWNDILKRNNIDKNKKYSDNCLYEILKSKIYDN